MFPLEIAPASIPYASWNEWNPETYLNTYFSNLGPDSFETLKFVVMEMAQFKNKPRQKILDFGCGPTIFGSIPAVPYASEIHLADYLHSNLNEVKKWINNEPKAFNWKKCIEYVLETEKIEVTESNIKNRSNQLKKLANKLLRCDASLHYPLGTKEKYPIVLSFFCADSATSSKEVWKIYMKNIINLVAPNGILIMSALRNCRVYKNGDSLFPCANINERDLKEVFFEAGILTENQKIQISSVPQCAHEGFSSLLLASAKKGPILKVMHKKSASK